MTSRRSFFSSSRFRGSSFASFAETFILIPLHRLTSTRRAPPPRQVGKTTLVQQLAEELGAGLRYASADEPTLRGADWIAQQWDAAGLVAREAGGDGAVLALDEIQKIPDWSETVKRHWDEDTRRKLPLKVVLLGSAPLLIARGMTESLAGRFELLHLTH